MISSYIKSMYTNWAARYGTEGHAPIDAKASKFVVLPSVCEQNANYEHSDGGDGSARLPIIGSRASGTLYEIRAVPNHSEPQALADSMETVTPINSP